MFAWYISGRFRAARGIKPPLCNIKEDMTQCIDIKMH